MSGLADLKTAVGFRFRPTDKEIINHYLVRKPYIDFSRIIKEVKLCSFDPWDLPNSSLIEDDEQWYFFCRPERKYNNSKMSNRTTKSLSGQWRPTGKPRPIKERGTTIGTKKTLTFYRYRTNSQGVKDIERTPWIIHEYQVETTSPVQSEWFFCKLKNKEDNPTNLIHKPRPSNFSLDSNFVIEDSLDEDGILTEELLDSLETKTFSFDDLDSNWDEELDIQALVDKDRESKKQRRQSITVQAITETLPTSCFAASRASAENTVQTAKLKILDTRTSTSAPYVPAPMVEPCSDSSNFCSKVERDQLIVKAEKKCEPPVEYVKERTSRAYGLDHKINQIKIHGDAFILQAGYVDEGWESEHKKKQPIFCHQGESVTVKSEVEDRVKQNKNVYSLQGEAGESRITGSNSYCHCGPKIILACLRMILGVLLLRVTVIYVCH